MKRLDLACVVTIALLTTIPPCLAWEFDTPWGKAKCDDINLDQALENPLTFFNPTGIPMTGDLVGFAYKHPDSLLEILTNPEKALYMPVAQSIVAGRNAVIARGGLPIPPQIRERLLPYFGADILDSVRWTTDWNAVQSTLQTVQMFLNRDTQAITLMNAVVFREPSSVDDIQLWAHELAHVEQYAKWGPLEFAERWTKNSSVTGPVEAPAYEKAASVNALVNASGSATEARLQTYKDCRPILDGKSTFACSVFVANGDTPKNVSFHARASSTSYGERAGKMRLMLLSQGRICNSGAGLSHVVDNETILEGPGYGCYMELDPGTSVKVLAFAPNSSADAKSISLDAQLTSRRVGEPASSCFPAGADGRAYCNLSVPLNASTTVFNIAGSASAKGGGKNAGGIKLQILRGGKPCNAFADVEVGVDNHTVVSGNGYSCVIVLRPGESERVDAIQFNHDATMEYTQLSASY